METSCSCSLLGRSIPACFRRRYQPIGTFNIPGFLCLRDRAENLHVYTILCVIQKAHQKSRTSLLYSVMEGTGYLINILVSLSLCTSARTGFYRLARLRESERRLSFCLALTLRTHSQPTPSVPSQLESSISFSGNPSFSGLT